MEKITRSEFVAACGALLAWNPSTFYDDQDLHALFDVLDARGEGFARLAEFTSLLHACSSATCPVEPANGNAGGLPVLRTWMLERRWLFADLVGLLGGPCAELTWHEFNERVAGGIPPLAKSEHLQQLFVELRSIGVQTSDLSVSEPQGMILVTTLVEALMASDSFQDAIGKRCLHVVIREARSRAIENLRVEMQGALLQMSGESTIGELKHAFAVTLQSMASPVVLADADCNCTFAHCIRLIPPSSNAAARMLQGFTVAVDGAYQDGRASIESLMSPQLPIPSLEREEESALDPLSSPRAERERFERICHTLRNSEKSLRSELLAQEWPRGLPNWITFEYARALLQPHVKEMEKVHAEDLSSEFLRAVARGSVAYLERGMHVIDKSESLVRVQTLLSCVEPYIEHLLTIRLDKLSGLERLAGIGLDNDVSEVFLRCRLHGTPHILQTSRITMNRIGDLQVTAKFDFIASYVFNLVTTDSLESLFTSVDDGFVVELWCSQASDVRMLSKALLPAVGIQTFLSSQSKSDALGSDFYSNLYFHDSSADSIQVVSCETPGETSEYLTPSISVRLTYTQTPPPNECASPLPWRAEVKGRSVDRAVKTSDLTEEALVRHDVQSLVYLDFHLGELTLHDVPLQSVTKDWLSSVAREGVSAGAGDDLQSEINFSVSASLRLPGAVKAPQAAVALEQDHKHVVANAFTCQSLDRVVQIDLHRDGFERDLQANGDGTQHTELDCTYAAALLNIPEVISTADTQRDDMKLSIELWLRAEWLQQEKQHSAQKAGAALRLAEQSVPMWPFLTMSRRDHFGQVWLTVPFEMEEGVPIADLRLSLATSLGSPDSAPSARSVSDSSPNLALISEPSAWSDERATSLMIPQEQACQCAISVCEVWLGWSPSEGDLQHSSTVNGACYYLELICQTSEKPIHHRVVPDGIDHVGEGRWLKLRVSEKSPLAITIDADNCEASLDLRLLRVANMHGANCQYVDHPSKANDVAVVATGLVQLPMQQSLQGAAPQFFVARTWTPLCRFSSCGDVDVPVARALIELEICPSTAAVLSQRFDATPQMPAGLAFPNMSLEPSSFKPTPWAMEAIARFGLPGALCDALLSAEERLLGHQGSDLAHSHARGRFRGLARSQDVEQAFLSSGHLEDYAFFKAALGPMLSTSTIMTYIPLLHWVLVRAVATAIRPTCEDVIQAILEVDKSNCGYIPLKVTNEILCKSQTPGGSPFPDWLFNFIQHWHVWSGFQNGAALDYISFVGDLIASGIDGWETVAKLLFEGIVAESPQQLFKQEDPTGPAVILQITNALHLPLVEDKFPNTYVSYMWQAGDVKDPLAASSFAMLDGLDFIGRTEVIYRTTCPAWDYTSCVPLPRNHTSMYPDAFEFMTFHLYVWHSESVGCGRGDGNVLIGVAVVSLAPLRTGIAEIDGYFHIVHHVSQHLRHPGGNAVQHGQIRVKVRPYYASFCSDSNIIASPPVTIEPLVALKTLESISQDELSTPIHDHEVTKLLFEQLLPGSIEGLRGTTDIQCSSETELRLSTRLSSNELAFTHGEYQEDGGFDSLCRIRQCHQQNMADLDELQQRLLSSLDPPFLDVTVNKAAAPSTDDFIVDSHAVSITLPPPAVGQSSRLPAQIQETQNNAMVTSPCAQEASSVLRLSGAGPLPPRVPSPSINLISFPTHVQEFQQSNLCHAVQVPHILQNDGALADDEIRPCTISAGPLPAISFPHAFQRKEENSKHMLPDVPLEDDDVIIGAAEPAAEPATTPAAPSTPVASRRQDCSFNRSEPDDEGHPYSGDGFTAMMSSVGTVLSWDTVAAAVTTATESVVLRDSVLRKAKESRACQTDELPVQDMPVARPATLRVASALWHDDRHMLRQRVISPDKEEKRGLDATITPRTEGACSMITSIGSTPVSSEREASRTIGRSIARERPDESFNDMGARRWRGRLDVKTQRLARIMRNGTGDDFSSSESD